MKIAVLADIHGNFHGLQRVAADIDSWQPDMVIVNGDTINRGPNNLDCWLYVKERAKKDGWILLRGNHEDYVLKLADPTTPTEGKSHEIFGFSRFTKEQLGDELKEINLLPDRYGFKGPDGKIFFVTHGTMLGNRVGVFPNTEDEDLRSRIAPAPAVFVTAHTHRPLIRTIDDTMVVNVGSAGLPFDGDQRLSYGQFTYSEGTGWQAEIIRLEYDASLLEAELLSTGFIPKAGPFGRLVLTEIRMARGIIGRWHKEWEEAFMNDEITLSDSVDQMMESEEYREYSKMPVSASRD